MKIELCSSFSGCGAFEKALSKTNFDYKIAAYCEIDKYASCAYSAIHGVSEDLNLGDVSKVNTKDIPYFNMLTWGFPCQDISLAGKQAGVKIGTRSGLYYEGYRILKDRLPKYSIIENVKNLTSKKHIEQFRMILQDLKDLGYKNHWGVLNAKGFGVPQNRERVFIVSILGDGEFDMPVETKSNIRLIDILETEVDEKYYVSSKMLKGFVGHNKNHEGKTGFVWKPRDINGVASCIRANGALCPTDNTFAIPIKEATKKGYAIAQEGDSINISQPNSKTRRGRVGNQVANTLLTGCEQCVVEPKRLGGLFDKDGTKHQAGAIYDSSAISPTLDTAQGGWRQPCIPTETRIRRLTPLEYWRLMGFDDSDFYKAKKALNDKFYNGKDRSDSQLYKIAGNSIVVNVLEAIFNNLIGGHREIKEQLELF